MDRFVIRTGGVKPAAGWARTSPRNISDSEIIDELNTHSSYPLIPPNPQMTPLDAFYSMIDKNCFEEIAFATYAKFQEYASQVETLPKALRCQKRIDSADILRHIGILIMMGIYRKPELLMHWKKPIGMIHA